LFVASRKSLRYLRKHFGSRVHEAFGLSLIYEDRNLSPVRTVTTNLSKYIDHRASISSFCTNVLERFEPDVVISDFEPVSAWWAWRRGVPFVSVNHQHLLTMCNLEHPSGHWLARLNAHVVTRCHYFGAAAYIILNFFRVPVQNNQAVLAPPVVRPVVQAAEPTAGEHIVVYTSDASWNRTLLNVLQDFPEQPFRVYGFDREEQIGNCQLRKTSTEGFVADVADSRGAIATGGFTLISECLHLRKRMLVLPIQGQYEQVVNAHYAEKLGLGLHRRRLDRTTLGEFIESLSEPAGNHSDLIRPDNDAFLRLFEQRLSQVCPAFAEGLTTTTGTARQRTNRRVRLGKRTLAPSAFGF
jgi:uncharacterized protein (TIGR00661 family)